MEIGNRLKELRIKAGYTQENVSDKIAVSRQTVSNWENSKTYPDIVSIIRLSDLYGISMDELLKGDANMIKHLEKSTDAVKSNRRLSVIGIINLIAIIAFILVIGDHDSSLLWITMCLEFVVLCAVDFSDFAHVGKPVQTASKILIVLCMVFYLGLIALLSTVAIDAFRSGQTETGMRLLISCIIVAVGVYVLFLRRFMKKLVQK